MEYMSLGSRLWSVEKNQQIYPRVHRFLPYPVVNDRSKYPSKVF